MSSSCGGLCWLGVPSVVGDALVSCRVGASHRTGSSRWVILPGPDELHGNAVFAATQQWFLAGPGGYMGTQSWRNADGSMTRAAIFACWDASAGVQTGWTGPNCARFGGEGTGAHCIVPVDLRANASYAVRVEAGE